MQLAESISELDQIKRIFGALFFGVPHNGMDIGSLIPMVNDQPNRFLLEFALPAMGHARVLTATIFKGDTQHIEDHFSTSSNSDSVSVG